MTSTAGDPLSVSVLFENENKQCGYNENTYTEMYFPDTVICDMLDQVRSVDMLFFKRGALPNFLFETYYRS